MLNSLIVVVENLIDSFLDFILVNQAVEQDNAILRQAGHSVAKRLFDKEVIRHIRRRATNICMFDRDFLCHAFRIEQVLDVHLDHKAATETRLANA